MAESTPVNPILANLQSLVRTARGHAQEKRAQKALETLNEARTLALAQESQTAEIVEAYGAIETELALMLQQLNDTRSALQHYMEAEAAFRKLPLEEPTQRIRLQLATTLVNMTGLLARERMMQLGLEKSSEAVMLLREVTGPAAEGSKVLLLGALQNRAALLIESKQHADAERNLAEALEVGASAIASGMGEIIPQMIETTGRVSQLRRMLNRTGESLPLVERAARWAQMAWEAGAPLGPRLYVATQFQLVDVNFGLERFAQAEDHLWKAVDTAKDLQSVVMATGFYFALMRLDDATLEAGNLPREEVVVASTEALERAKAGGCPADLLEMLASRSQLLTGAGASEAERLLAQYSGAEAQMSANIKAMLPLLKSDVEWERAGRPSPKLA
jgi:tetratricopeptide (TPR) repeat protein